MRIDPIIPIWLMLILCVGMAFLKRRKRSAYIRQIAAIILIFLINLRTVSYTHLTLPTICSV